MPPDDEKPRVLPFKPRIVPATDPLPPDPAKVDEDAIKVLEMVLADAKAGRLHGVAIVAGLLDENGHMFDCTTFCSDAVTFHTLGFIGATTMMLRRMQDDMELGPIDITEEPDDGDHD